MGFFSDLKEDLSQVVNELRPEELLKAPMSDLNQDKKVSEDTLIKEAAVEMVKNVTAQLQSREVLTEQMPDTAEVTESTEGQEAQEPYSIQELQETQKFQEPQALQDIQTLQETQELQTQQKSQNVEAIETVTVTEAEEKDVDRQSVIAADMTIAGDIVSESSVELKGSINGNIDIAGKLIISGYVTGDSKAAEVVAEGAKINGNIYSSGAVRIGASSVVIGNVIANGATIAGAIKGDIDVKGPVVLEASAIVKGNIKSQSVRINDGAVIDGMCSQCYAEINPAAFFDDFTPELKNTKI